LFSFTAVDAMLVAEVGERSIKNMPAGAEQQAIAGFTLGLRHAIKQAEADTAPVPAP
jgi:hypothetical protein